MRAFAVVIALFGSSAFAQVVFIDKGACPGEGCRYGETWIARKPIGVFDAPASTATASLTIQPGESVQTLTGEVHTIPGRFDVARASEEFRPGDEVLVYTYLGEGWFRVRHNGEMKEADLGFSPWGGTTGTRCDQSARCWGSLREELLFDWWVLVRTGASAKGWVRVARGVAAESWRYGK